jgi:hypothetical protein
VLQLGTLTRMDAAAASDQYSSMSIQHTSLCASMIELQHVSSHIDLISEHLQSRPPKSPPKEFGVRRTENAFQPRPPKPFLSGAVRYGVRRPRWDGDGLGALDTVSDRAGQK